MTTALIYDPIFLEHITPRNHPDQPQRLEMAMKVLEALNWLERDGLVQIVPRAATEDELAAVHDRPYIRKVKASAHKVAQEQESVRRGEGGVERMGGPLWSPADDGVTQPIRLTRYFATDTYISARSYEAAIKAAGATL